MQFAQASVLCRFIGNRYDTMQFHKNLIVATICKAEMAASMGAVYFFVPGEKGKTKRSYPFRVMIHQPLGGAQGPGQRNNRD